MPKIGAGAVTIEFVDELTIKTVGESHKRLLQAFEAGAAMQVDIAPDASVDLTFVQLMESARRTAREAGRTLALTTPAQGQLRETLERGGFLAAPQHREFWLNQSEDR